MNNEEKTKLKYHYYGLKGTDGRTRQCKSYADASAIAEKMLAQQYIANDYLPKSERKSNPVTIYVFTSDKDNWNDATKGIKDLGELTTAKPPIVIEPADYISRRDYKRRHKEFLKLMAKNNSVKLPSNKMLNKRAFK